MCARFKCDDCGAGFAAELEGKASDFDVYRCDDCDRVLRAEKMPMAPETLDEPCQCGGRYWRNRPPKCPECRSPHVSQLE